MNNEIFAIWINKPGTYMMPFIYEACIASWQINHPTMKTVVYASNPELKFNLLSRDTTEVRILDEEFPGLLEEADKITGDVPSGIKFAHMSDYIRYTILAERGGIYVDCDLICISSMTELVQSLVKDNKPVVMALEDSMRICNAFMACLTNEGKKYYEDLIQNYRENYVPTSYTFNSIKYLNLLNRRYAEIIHVLPFKEGMFYPNWEKNENGDLNLLKSENSTLCGYGVHLYNTDVKWKSIRNDIDHFLWRKDCDWWIVKYLNDIIARYIKLMSTSSLRDITKDKILVNNLTELYGEKYLDQFKGGK